jgi:hypothetical protein
MIYLLVSLCVACCSISYANGWLAGNAKAYDETIARERRRWEHNP